MGDTPNYIFSRRREEGRFCFFRLLLEEGYDPGTRAAGAALLQSLRGIIHFPVKTNQFQL